MGKVEDFYSHVQVMALILKSDVAVGDTIRVKGHTTDIVQKLDSMQINHAAVTAARAGESVGIKINERCRKGDRVYKI
ncbi:MAG: translation elongation factor-like protein [Elusimicrobia bacterium]|nr:translation elongation factor-like protein [Elusimicrobiota bacterium]